MNTPAALTLCGVLFCLLLVTIRVSVWLNRIGVRSSLVIAVAVLTLPAATMCGAYLLARVGRPQTGIVAAKSENLEIAQRGLAPSVHHSLILTVADPSFLEAFKLDPRIRVGNLTFEVNEHRFDALKTGDPIAMREVRILGLRFARFEDDPWWDIAPARLESLLPGPRGAERTASGRVMAVRTVRDTYVSAWFADSGQGASHVLLEQPYEEVRFQFTAANGADIVTLDRIDEGSAGALEAGMEVPLHYPEGRPREAQLGAGRRDYAVRNAWSYWSGDIVVMLSAAGLMIGVSLWLQRRRRSS